MQLEAYQKCMHSVQELQERYASLCETVKCCSRVMHVDSGLALSDRGLFESRVS